MTDKSAQVIASDIADSSRIYRNAIVKSSTLKDDCIIGDMCRIENSQLGYKAQVYPFGIMYNSILGDYSYIQKNSSVWHAEIGKFCSISWNASIGGGEHDFHKVTAHSMLYAPFYGFVDKPMYDRFVDDCKIGNDVWIAAGVSILRGVTVGDGAVIGAGAVVTKDVEPYSIVAGVPAKKIGQRCSDELIAELLEMKWWDFDPNIIKDNIHLFNLDLNINTISKIRNMKNKSR